MEYAIGVDMGGTNIRAAVIAQNGRIISRLKTKTGKEVKGIIRNTINIIEELSSKKISAIGLGVPGIIDKKNGIVKHSPNLPFKNLDIKKIIQKKFRMPVFIDNDANCFTVGESLYGAGKGKSYVVGITLGTGVGSGIVIEGKPYYGKGNASEAGHSIIDFNGPKSKCGHAGCIESYVSARSILRQAKALNIKNPKGLFDLAEKKNKKAIKLWQEIGFYLGVGITNIADILDPDIVIVGGNISNAWEFFNKTMKDIVKKRAFIQGVKIVKSKLGDNAGVLGAAALCFSNS